MTHSFGNIPSEMHFFRQWIVWRFEDKGGKKPDKVPYSPLFNGHAAVDAPGTWGAYDDAVRRYEAGGMDGIGFVLTEDDPYCFIDLDDADGHQETFDRQKRILDMCPGYAELSPSGTGLHIITKAAIERGRKRSKIEVYSNARYMTMTGNVYRDAPIVDAQEFVSMLWHEMGGPASLHGVGVDAEERETDEQVLDKLFNANNGEKARDLYAGDWTVHYDPNSQSEADQALINMLAFYTQNRFQIVRLFQASNLGKRDKAKRVDYLNRSINLAFDRMLPPIDIEGLKIQFEDLLAQTKTAPPEGPNGAVPSLDPTGQDGGSGSPQVPPSVGIVNSPIAIPPGLVGELADFIYKSSPRPVHTIALTAALGFVAGIGGRAFNVSNTGLNQYFMLLAPTGTGKEAMNNGISKVVSAAKAMCPTIAEFMGPGEIRSDAALLKWLAKHNCVLSIAGEFGLRLKQMSDQRASAHETGLRRVLLDLYGKSGAGNILGEMAYSDRDKNTLAIASPSFTMIGESTPERFYEALDESMIYEGLLPRFTFFEYDGPRPKPNEHHGFVPVPHTLVERVAKFVAHVQATMAAGKVHHVKFRTDALNRMNAFRDYCDAMMDQSDANEITRNMWSRAHVKAMKLAATVAVGLNFDDPWIDVDCVNWATNIIAEEVLSIINRFKDGRFGSTDKSIEAKQVDDVKKAIRSFMVNDEVYGEKYGLKAAYHRQKMVTHQAISQKVRTNAAFRNDRMGQTFALKRSLQTLLDHDVIREVPSTQLATAFNSTAKAYSIADPGAILNG